MTKSICFIDSIQFNDKSLNVRVAKMSGCSIIRQDVIPFHTIRSKVPVLVVPFEDDEKTPRD